jgi:ring-1,2-phenylacetyl-CoA epoxidase subunit PaaD
VERERRELLAAGGRPVPCPYCGSAETERAASFGPFHMSETYFCRTCRSPFSRIKWEDPSRAPR